jgi:hypothetical protein
LDIINDFIYINKTVFKKTLNSFKKTWPIIFTGIIYIILSAVVYNVLGLILRGPLAIFGGILTAIVSSSLISNYLYLLFNIINYDRLSFQHFKDGFSYFLWKIYGVFFIGFIGNFLLSFVFRIFGSGASFLNIIISLTIGVLLNPLPETLYIKSYRAWDSILKSIEFMQENWINWLIPNLVFYILIYLATGKILSGLFNTYLSFNAFINIRSILFYFIGQTIFSFMMIYRGYLYKMLSGSTRRKRRR